MTVGIDLFHMAVLSNFGAGDDDEAISNPRAKDPDGHWKNDCAEVIASGCGGDMTHCYAAFTETDALLGTGGGGGAAAHWKNDCAEVNASDCGGDITHCFAAFTETDAVVSERGGRDGTFSKNACSEVSTGACGAHMTHCHDVRGGHDPAHGKRIRAGSIARGVRDHAAFIETNHSMGKPVSSRISDSPENLASRSLSTPIEGRREEWDLCFALLQTVSAVMEHVLRYDSGTILSEIIGSYSAGNVEAIGSTKCVAASLNTALEHFLERSAPCLKHPLPTDCRTSALSSHAEAPGSAAALGSLP